MRPLWRAWGLFFCYPPLRHCLLDSLNSTIFTRWLTLLYAFVVGARNGCLCGAKQENIHNKVRPRNYKRTLLQFADTDNANW